MVRNILIAAGFIGLVLLIRSRRKNRQEPLTGYDDLEVVDISDAEMRIDLRAANTTESARVGAHDSPG